jgi:hypothetical protein
MSIKIQSRRMIGLAGILAMVTLAGSLSLPIAAAAQCGMPGTAPCPGTLLTTYYDTNQPLTPKGATADNLLTLINPVGCANPDISPVCPARDQCAMIYVFDGNENLGECCGCILTSEQPLSLSVQRNLTSNWGLSTGHSTGSIDIISSLPNIVNPSNLECNPAAQYTTSRVLNGYILHNQTPGVPEVPLADAGDAASRTVNSLISKCAKLIGAGSGGGVCNCPTNPTIGAGRDGK